MLIAKLVLDISPSSAPFPFPHRLFSFPPFPHRTSQVALASRHATVEL